MRRYGCSGSIARHHRSPTPSISIFTASSSVPASSRPPQPLRPSPQPLNRHHRTTLRRRREKKSAGACAPRTPETGKRKRTLRTHITPSSPGPPLTPAMPLPMEQAARSSPIQAWTKDRWQGMPAHSSSLPRAKQLRSAAALTGARRRVRHDGAAAPPSPGLRRLRCYCRGVRRIPNAARVANGGEHRYKRSGGPQKGPALAVALKRPMAMRAGGHVEIVGPHPSRPPRSSSIAQCRATGP
jgi:hypothetical protein